VVVTRSARDTTLLGRRLGRLLAPGDVVALVGELGAGKTQLARGTCEGAGVDPADVTSPTFAIVQTYRGRLPVHHADLYRLGDVDELYATGLPDLLGGDGALLVEWADRITGWLPAERLVVRMAEVPRRPSWRRLVLEAAGPRHEALAASLARRPRPSRSGVTRRRAPARKPEKTHEHSASRRGHHRAAAAAGPPGRRPRRGA
jgi:tRNA threonylcarbamoyladenosine biosynthesis protein TsaE